MTIASTARKAGPLLGTGTQTAFPFTFKVFAGGDLLVTRANALGIETALVLDVDYTVTLNSNQETSPGGTVTYPISGAALPVGSVLAIVGDLDYDQPLDLPSGGNFSPLALENQLDRATMQIQQLNERLDRTFSLPVSSSVDSAVPAPTAGYVIGWDALGERLTNLPAAVGTSLIDLAAPGGSALVGFQQAGTGAVARTVEGKLRESVSVKDFGAVGDGVADDLLAITAGAKHALTIGADLYFPKGAYFVSAPVVIDNISVVAWANFSVVGAGYTTGQGLYQSGVGNGTVIVTEGTGAFDVNLTNFFNESVRFRNMSFYNQGARGATVAIQINKNSPAYTRGWNFSKLGFYNFARCLGIKGQSDTRDHNYIGTTKISEISVFGCDNGIHLVDVIMNLAGIEYGMFHGCTAYGITLEGGAAVQNGSGGIFSIKDSHFEGCEPAGIKGGAYLTRVTLDNVSSENTGDVSGLGLITGELNSLRLWVNNQNYPFVFMPPEYRLPRGAIVSASCMIKVSGEAIVVDTPDTVTPVVSNNATYNQTDTSTVILSPIPIKTAFSGIKAFKNTLAGHISNSGISPDSSALPPGLQPMFVGATKIASNTGESYTAPAAGYLIFTWLAAATGSNGLSVSNITIDGVNKGPTIGFRWPNNFVGAYTILIPVTAGQVLTTAELTAYTTTWRTPAMIYFRETPGLCSEIATGFPRISRRTETVASDGTLDISQIGESAKPFAVKVRVSVNGGSLGFYEWVARGNGSNSTRVLVDIVKSLSAGIAIADHGFPLNADFYRKTLTNTSGASVVVNIEQEILN